MPSSVLIAFLALHATAFISVSQTCVAALPLQPQRHSIARISSPPSHKAGQGHTTSSRLLSSRTYPASGVNPYAIRDYQTQHARASSSPNRTIYSQLTEQYQAARENSKAIKRLAAMSSSDKAKDPAFQEECRNQFEALHTNVLAQQATISTLGSQRKPPRKGLDNFDPHNDIEILVKNLVNTHKDTLRAAYVMIKDIPILGGLLAPAVYDIKCLLDEILEFAENETDRALNKLGPLLQALLEPSTAGCPSGAVILGLCV